MKTTETTIIDKSLLQPICELPQCPQILADLEAQFLPCACTELIEEILVGCHKAQQHELHQRMLSAVVSWEPRWIDHPLERIFRQLVLREEVSVPWVSTDTADLIRYFLHHPDRFGDEGWFRDRRTEKEERLQARFSQQQAFTAFLKAYRKEGVVFNSRDSFREWVLSYYLFLLDSPFKMRALQAYLGNTLQRWHGLERRADIQEALASTSFENLEQMKYVRNYVLLELAYDLGPICHLPSGERIISSKGKAQMNHEDDQQYVAAAFAGNRLLTCDTDMHTMAEMFSKRGLWLGKSTLIVRAKVADFGRTLRQSAIEPQ